MWGKVFVLVCAYPSVKSETSNYLDKWYVFTWWSKPLCHQRLCSSWRSAHTKYITLKSQLSFNTGCNVFVMHIHSPSNDGQGRDFILWSRLFPNVDDFTDQLANYNIRLSVWNEFIFTVIHRVKCVCTCVCIYTAYWSSWLDFCQDAFPSACVVCSPVSQTYECRLFWIYCIMYKSYQK